MTKDSGWGIIAIKDFKAGDLLIVEKPIAFVELDSD